jgi:hypothetical protein|uniref:Uncharacterized protein n=1 Tax=Zea mays TaxID=4577 RepID=A0A804N3K2_MAIZE
MEWQHPAQAKPERRGIHGGVGPAKGESKGVGMPPMSSCTQGRKKNSLLPNAVLKGALGRGGCWSWAFPGCWQGRAGGRHGHGGNGARPGATASSLLELGLVRPWQGSYRQPRARAEKAATKESRELAGRGSRLAGLRKMKGRRGARPWRIGGAAARLHPWSRGEEGRHGGLCASCCISAEQMARRSWAPCYWREGAVGELQPWGGREEEGER